MPRNGNARPGPDLSNLPPAIRASLAKLAAGENAPEEEGPPPGPAPAGTST
jgi:hypothetical protein